MPKRIQMSRKMPWRADNPNAVRVDRNTRWGNPYRVTSQRDGVEGVRVWQVEGPSGPIATFGPGQGGEGPQWWAHLTAVEAFLLGIHPAARPASLGGLDYPLIDEIQEHLAGHDLACWCPLNMPCHADVLLEIANGGDPR